jgi:hypothetical protein
MKSLFSTCFLAPVLGLALLNSAVAQEKTAKEAQAQPAPETEAIRFSNGFGGYVFVTADADWREKWNTSPNTVPHFNEAKTVARGQKAFVLIFFSNPKLGAGNHVSLSCDLDVTRPDGTASTHQTGVACFQGEVKGGPDSVYLAAPVIGFTGEDTDPAGTWTVRVSLKDDLRNTVLPLKTSFILE